MPLCERALDHPSLDDALKRQLRPLRQQLDLVALLADVRAAQRQLGEHVDRRAGAAAKLSKPAEGTRNFADGLGKSWMNGDWRAIHPRRYVRRKPVPRQASMLDPHVRDIETWLAAAPHLRAVDVLNRLNERTPGAFGAKQLRTLQRFVRVWRDRTAKLLIDGAEATILGAPLGNIAP